MNEIHTFTHTVSEAVRRAHHGAADVGYRVILDGLKRAEGLGLRDPFRQQTLAERYRRALEAYSNRHSQRRAA